MSSLLLQITGVVYLLSSFFVARIFESKFKNFKSKINPNLLIVDNKVNICDNNDIIYIENDNFEEDFYPNNFYILDLSEK